MPMIGAQRAERCGIEVAAIVELDRGVHRVSTRDGPDWRSPPRPAGRVSDDMPERINPADPLTADELAEVPVYLEDPTTEDPALAAERADAPAPSGPAGRSALRG
jgi:hypothetical protein